MKLDEIKHLWMTAVYIIIWKQIKENKWRKSKKRACNEVNFQVNHFQKKASMKVSTQFQHKERPQYKYVTLSGITVKSVLLHEKLQ